eukprot:CAMPEP_0118706544 /NCGR_PEP_ID=MMETSP0800-20121206/20621_1 /TAXON_ID=210618 ORGANISM="Striatella unipunctata, Strain CCMP2910" /NCGR_SAMPLE_ID=MMETSP0800 /ASSEMBLY_ACC=CAM_ASM_000638 /LENGTH=130 /DNA_ID=CAMNT_0006609099 /DNA_START=147 /DNA_END=537 /DNA_ORIENTATION=+
MEFAVLRQWQLIQEHAVRLRPELRFAFDSLQLWLAPGDSEEEMSKNNPAVPFVPIQRSRRELAEDVSVKLLGFDPQWLTKDYDDNDNNNAVIGGGEQVFSVERNDDGSVPTHLLPEEAKSANGKIITNHD